MRKKLAIVFLLFVGFFYLLQLASHMPELIHNYHSFFSFRNGNMNTRLHFIDLVLSFLFSIIPYLILFYYFPKSRFWGVTLGLTSLPIIFVFCFVFESFMGPIRLKTYFSEHFIYDLIYSALGISYYFFRYSHYQELQQKESIIQRRQAELSFLRSQINPHFLFNSLNNIYSLVYSKSDQSLNALATLSDLLRYIIYDAEEKVDLQKELEYINKFISLQRLRFDHEIPVSIEIIGNVNKVFLPPLLLIPFVENAFKHGDLSISSEGISIHIFISNKKILFRCSNKKGFHQKDPKRGIGLQNVIRRLDLLYARKYDLQIQEEDYFYNIFLELSYAN